MGNMTGCYRPLKEEWDGADETMQRQVDRLRRLSARNAARTRKYQALNESHVYLNPLCQAVMDRQRLRSQSIAAELEQRSRDSIFPEEGVGSSGNAENSPAQTSVYSISKHFKRRRRPTTPLYLSTENPEPNPVFPELFGQPKVIGRFKRLNNGTYLVYCANVQFSRNPTSTKVKMMTRKMLVPSLSFRYKPADIFWKVSYKKLPTIQEQPAEEFMEQLC